METMALMTKIREWQLPIKSHMAELTPDLVEQINVRLNPPKDSGALKKTVARKKVAVAVASVKKVIGTEKLDAASVAPSVGAKVVRRKAVSPMESEGKKQEHEEHEVATDSKLELADEFEDTESEVENIDHVEVDEKLTEVEHKPIEMKAASVVGVPVEKIAIVDKIEIVESPTKTTDLKVEVKEAKLEVVETSVKTEKVLVNDSKDSKEVPAITPEKTNVDLKKPFQKPFEEKKVYQATQGPHHHPARKIEVVVGQSGFASPQKPANEVVRKNIVGRMDLSRVTPPPRTGGDRSGSYTPRNQQGGGGPAGGMAPRGLPRNNIRTGFVAAASTPPQPIEDLEAHHKSKFDDRNKKFSKSQTEAPGGAGGGVEAEEVVFNPAEFRKREMVFQPKKKKGMLNREGLKTQITKPKASKRVLKVNGTMKLSDVCETMGLKAAQLIKVLMTNGVMANMNTALDVDTLALICPEFGWETQNVFRTADEILEDTAFGDIAAESVPRPPVVTVMGHVDHGKTSLLDAIRQTDVVAGEAGGITQHIGAYQVKIDSGETITFLDTPGHEAFTAMRARGANATDIAVIVVAADDGMMPQTAEAINHAKVAGVPIVIAINKMDKPGANPDRIKQQLTEHEIVPEEWGGSNIFCQVSALKRTGISELLEQLLLVAEMQELKANPKRSGTGIVIESRLDKGKGSVATLLVQDGTVRVSDLIVAGAASGRVRSMMNYKGERVEEATPGMPVELLGLAEVPAAGDKFDVVKDEKTLERVLEVRRTAKEKAQSTTTKMSLEDLFAKVKEGEQKTLNVILKSDVMGSSEAIQGMFQKLNTKEVKLKVIHSAVGGITEGDVLLATTAKAVIIGFNTRPDTNAQNLAKRGGVELRTYGIVYELIDDLKRLMSGLLDPDIVEQAHGRAEVRNTFNVPKVGTIAGCSIIDGKVIRSHLVRLIRDGVVVYQGKISSLKRFKDDVKEVATGYECGIGIENFNDIKVGDVIEAYTREEIRKTLTELQPSV
jgi:translation initiation factor IF-2